MLRRAVDQRVGAMSKAPELQLPAAAAELWAMVRDVVDDAMTSLGDAPYRIGGGTILAARWEHRESFDVDLTLSADTALGSLRAEHGDPSGFEARLKALGGAPTYYPDLKLWRVAFDDGERGLDVWAHEPEIGSGEEQRTSTGGSKPCCRRRRFCAESSSAPTRGCRATSSTWRKREQRRERHSRAP